jgi:hypothetical protein
MTYDEQRRSPEQVREGGRPVTFRAESVREGPGTSNAESQGGRSQVPETRWHTWG